MAVLVAVEEWKQGTLRALASQRKETVVVLVLIAEVQETAQVVEVVLEQLVELVLVLLVALVVMALIFPHGLGLAHHPLLITWLEVEAVQDTTEAVVLVVLLLVALEAQTQQEAQQQQAGQAVVVERLAPHITKVETVLAESSISAEE
jgi:hypothetical protein